MRIIRITHLSHPRARYVLMGRFVCLTLPAWGDWLWKRLV